MCDDDLPSFLVVSGLNGAGKTHLLEAIKQGALAVDDVPKNEVKLFNAWDLVPPADNPKSPTSLRLHPQALLIQLQQLMRNYRRSIVRGNQNPPTLDEYLRTSIRGSTMTERSYDRLLVLSGKEISQITLDDIRNCAMTIEMQGDPFTTSITDIFLSYHQRWIDNAYYEFLANKGRLDAHWLGDEQFRDHFGVPPWESLDQSFRLINLPYTVNHPEGFDPDAAFGLILTDSQRDIAISTSDLSTGEKTLVSLALSVYGGSRLGGVITFPRVLLFDEPDASLHPSMVADLLRVAQDVLVDTHGTKVILTTHSPTTVALAHEGSLYRMDRDEPRLRHVSRDQALGTLTTGISVLSVTMENRRQVFVESKVDEGCYQELFRLARKWLPNTVSLEFIASAKDGNDTRVIDLVTHLRAAGVSTVHGMIDRDSRLGAPEHVHYIAERYTLENLVLDPFMLGYLMLRQRLVDPTELRLADDFDYRDAPSHAQAIIDGVVDLLRQESDTCETIVCSYVGGIAVEIPLWYLNLPGHELEDSRIRATFRNLNQYQGEQLKTVIITLCMRDLPEFIPVAIVNAFRLIAESRP